MRIGHTLSGSENRAATLRRPIHLIGRIAPETVTTLSPIANSSTGTSPRSVWMSVPRQKQAGSAMTEVSWLSDVVAPSNAARLKNVVVVEPLMDGVKTSASSSAETACVEPGASV